MKIYNVLKKITLSLLFLIFSSLSLAGDWNTNKSGVVLDGYDVIAYHTMDKAMKGSSKYSVEYDGAKFYFMNIANRNLFKKNPKAYAPKYNAYCAFAMGAKNMKVPANADTFKMYNGELLVFFNDYNEGQKFNTKIPWNKNEKKLFSKAEINWKNIN